MAISFDQLPNERPNNLLEKGFYFGTITNAEMKSPKDTSKPDYLNLTIDLFDKNQKKVGRVYDIITESDAPAMRYKLKRLCTALNLNLSGKSFELKQLVKSLKDKNLIVDIKIDENETYGNRNVVNVFDNNIYYPTSEANELMGQAADSLFDMVNAEDADDAEGSEDFDNI